MCSVSINNITVTQAHVEGTKQEARDDAAKKTLEILATRCYTIKIKNQYLSDGTTVSAEDLDKSDQIGANSEKIQSSNMGHKLLKLMGWDGGGLGKGGAGISEPITATALGGRAGFGSGRGADKAFKDSVRKVIEEYALSSNPYDLVFTTGFDNEQRKHMHM